MNPILSLAGEAAKGVAKCPSRVDIKAIADQIAVQATALATRYANDAAGAAAFWERVNVWSDVNSAPAGATCDEVQVAIGSLRDFLRTEGGGDGGGTQQAGSVPVTSSGSSNLILGIGGIALAAWLLLRKA